MNDSTIESVNSIHQFFRDNKLGRPNVKYPASKSFLNADGTPIEWELRSLPSPLMEKLRKTASNNDDLIISVTAASVVFPNLRDSALQDSYDVRKPEDLLMALLYSDELVALEMKVLEINNFSKNIAELVNEAKN